MLHLVNDIAKKLLPIVNDQGQAIFEAWLLIEKAAQLPRALLIAQFRSLTAMQEKKLATLVAQRVEDKMPLAYVLGDVAFAGISLVIRPPILIPRPETEEMVLWVIERFKHRAQESLVVLDVCTGSGCIALAIATAFPSWSVIGIDINSLAIDLAQENQQLLKLSNVRFEVGSLFQSQQWAVPADLIISNPPYIDRARIDRVTNDVLAWEDHQALFAESSGWVFYEGLINLSKRIIKYSTSDTPHVIAEFGVDQENMGQYLFDNGCRSIEIKNDIAGLNRWAGWQI